MGDWVCSLPRSMFDVGGQRDERRKWIQCFNGTQATKSSALRLFCAFSCYRSFPPLTCMASFLCRRCDCHYLRGGQQQLQHGHSGGQSDQPPAGGSEPLQEHLEQQVSADPIPPTFSQSLSPSPIPDRQPVLGH